MVILNSTVRAVLRIFLALLALQVTGLPAVAATIIEHVACDEEGDGCCPTDCNDTDERCDDCACCFHVRPMLADQALVTDPSTGRELAPSELSSLRPSTDP